MGQSRILAPLTKCVARGRSVILPGAPCKLGLLSHKTPKALCSEKGSLHYADPLQKNYPGSVSQGRGWVVRGEGRTGQLGQGHAAC